MITVYIPNRQGTTDPITTYYCNEFPFEKLSGKTFNSKQPKKQKEFCLDFGAFDIETSTIIPPDQDEKPYGFMYIWQICINGIPCYGRTWREFEAFLKRLKEHLQISNDKKFIFYIHNASYEYQFVKDFLERAFGYCKIFATKKRKVIYFESGGFIFKCSYFLTNMTLAKALENEKGVKHLKAVNDLDYRVIRTPETELNATELGYCVADVVGLYELILNRLKNEEDNLESIPFTSTGYVRRDCRKACKQDRHYRQKVFNKNKLTLKVYTMLKEAGRGGNTHANRYMSGRIWRESESSRLKGYDIVSSYPTQLLERGFPAHRFTYYGEIKGSKKEILEELTMCTDNMACLFRLYLSSVQIKKDIPIPYIAKGNLTGYANNKRTMRCDNGRILYADAITLTITDVDWKIISQQYDFDDIIIKDMYVSRYAPLPDAIRGQVKEYFRLKSKLKYDIKHSKSESEKEDLQYLYAKSKNRLNAIFGMMYTDPVRSEIYIEDGEMKDTLTEYKKNGQFEKIDEYIEDKLEKYNNSYNSFLVYSWGIWTTAWARYQLQELLDACASKNADGEQGIVLYCDTDSCKCINPPEEKIEALNEKYKQMSLDTEAYVDYEGERYYMGLFEDETMDCSNSTHPSPTYHAFTSLGAKKYAYTTIEEDGREELHITISGVQKKAGAKEMGSIEKFKPGFIFKDAGGQTLYYNDVKIHYIEVDGCKIETASNIGMVDSTYTLGITGEYAELINFNLYNHL